MPIVAYQYCTGAVHVFVQPNSGSLYQFSGAVPASAAYLGTCEQYPLVDGDQMWEPTFNDIAGPRPFDKQYFGDSKVLVLDINKMVQSTMDFLINHGAETSIARGLYKNLTADVTGTFTTWLAFANYGTIAAVPGLPPGEIYFNCSVPKSGYDPIGTRSRKTRVVIEADPAYSINNLVGQGTNGFITYSIDPVFFTGLPGVS